MWSKWAEVSKMNLKNNVEFIRQKLSDLEPIAVVKDDAYGHEAAVVVPELLRNGITKFAVVYAKDALMLSEFGAEWILVLDDPPVSGMCSEYERRGIRFCITDSKWLSNGLLELPIKFHLFVDVGMHREGVPWYETNTIKEICKVVGNRLEGICSHLSNGLSDSQVLATQEERFREVLSIVPEGLMVHLSNSASLYNGRFPYATHFRPGISLYGYGHPGLKPVLSLKARVIHEHVLEPGEGLSYGWTWRATEPTHVVTVPVGYGDGYNRKLSNKAIAGSKAGSLQQIGTVTMDFTMFKAPKNVAVGDEIVLMGEWEEGHFWADEMAQVIGSIPYEVLTSINPRVPRVLV